MLCPSFPTETPVVVVEAHYETLEEDTRVFNVMGVTNRNFSDNSQQGIHVLVLLDS